MTGIVVALDLSLTSSGWAYNDADGDIQFGTFKPGPKRRGGERLIWIRDQINGLFGEDFDLLVIEELPPSTRFAGNQSGVAELHGVMKADLFLQKLGATYINVAKVKKYATGKGNADKPAMLSAAIQRLGYTGSSGDEVDALWMLHMGLDHLGRPAVAMPAVNRTALDTIEWAG